MSGGRETRVSIPNNIKKTIQDIREITKKQHSDDEIYAVLKECSMDPNETAQKLLYLDTFHEVKSKKDRKKENMKGRASEDSRMPPGTQRRVSRGGGQGMFSDAGGGRNSSARREIADRGSMPSSVKPVLQKTKNIAATPITKASTGTPNGVANISNGSSVHGRAPKCPMGVDNIVREGGSAVDAEKLGAAAPHPAALASEPTFGSLNHEKPVPIPNHLPVSVSATSASDSSVYSASDPAVSNHIQENKKGSGDAIGSELSRSVKPASKSANSVDTEKTPSDSKVAEKNGNIKLSQPCVSSNHDDSLAKLPSQNDKQSHLEPTVPLKVVAPEVATNTDSRLSVAKHVTFPNHIQVPETLKNILTFGSIDATFGLRLDSANGAGGNNFSMGAVESAQDADETAKEPSPRNDIVSSHVQGDLSENPLSLPNALDKLSPSEGNVSSNIDSKSELPKQDLQLQLEGPHNPTAVHPPSYNIGFFPPMLGSQPLPMEGHDNPAHEMSRLPNFVGGNSAAVPSPNSTPPLPSTTGVSQQSNLVYRQTYPNFYPYGHYLSPYYMPPMHQFLGPNGFPPQPSAGNVFLPPPTVAAAAGVKFPLPHFKAGANVGNPTQYSIQSGGSFINRYAPGGSFINSYAPGSTVTSGSSVGNEDLGASQLKDNHIYTTGQLTEGSPVWIHTPGQDMSGLQVSSMYNHPQGQRLTFSPMQAGHGAMAGIYPPGQTIATPTFMQQSQAVAGATETMGPQSAAYQQPQHTQINWN